MKVACAKAAKDSGQHAHGLPFEYRAPVMHLRVLPPQVADKFVVSQHISLHPIDFALVKPRAVDWIGLDRFLFESYRKAIPQNRTQVSKMRRRLASTADILVDGRHMLGLDRLDREVTDLGDDPNLLAGQLGASTSNALGFALPVDSRGYLRVGFDLGGDRNRSSAVFELDGAFARSTAGVLLASLGHRENPLSRSRPRVFQHRGAVEFQAASGLFTAVSNFETSKPFSRATDRNPMRMTSLAERRPNFSRTALMMA